MLPPLSVFKQRQIETKHLVLCLGFVGLAFVTIIWFGLFQKTQAAENILPTNQVHTLPTKISPKLVGSYGKLPLSFEANHGQTDARVRFLARGSGYTIFLTADEAVLTLQKSQPGRLGMSRLGKFGFPSRLRRFGPVDSRARRWPTLVDNLNSLWPSLIPDLSQMGPDPNTGKGAVAGPESQPPQVVRMRLVGGNPQGRVVGLDELPGKSNYFIGNDPKKWRINVANYAKVRYEGVYPGVDLVYYGNPQQLEYDFMVAPGADPKVIQLAVAAMSPSPDGGQRPPLQIAANGDLVVKTDGGEVRLHKPLVYQPEGAALPKGAATAENHRSVDASFVLLASNQIGFEVANYDKTQPLIIDPVLSYSSFLGGSGPEGGTSVSIAVDSLGNAYVAGGTASVDFPVTPGAEQTKFAGGGELPCPSNPCGDAFVAKIDPTGSTRLYSTYLGGSNDDYAYGLAVDASGDAFVAGDTESGDFPIFPKPGAFQTTYGGGHDVFVTELNPTGSALVYSTYIGGSSDDHPEALAIDASGNAYVAGDTFSSDFPIFPNPGAFQTQCMPPGAPGPCPDVAFVSKLNPTGTKLVYSTYLGGSDYNWAEGVAVDSSGNAVVTGETLSIDFPVTGGAYQPSGNPPMCGGGPCGDAFISLLNAAGSALLYSTYFGGSDVDYANTAFVDSTGKIYTVGATSSDDFPVTPGAFQTTYGGSPCDWCYFGDAFVAKFDPTQAGHPSLVYSTYLGGNNYERASGIAVDASGNAYVCGSTASSNFPTLNPIQAVLGGGEDAFVTELNRAGSALVYSTYLGGSEMDHCDFVAVDASGNAYAGGVTDSANFPTTPGVFQPTFGGVRDVFVAKIGPADNTPAGSPTVPLTNVVSVGFSEVTESGTTSVTNLSSAPAPPAGFNLGTPAAYYDVSTTATFSGSLSVCINYKGVTFSGPPQLFHYETGQWVDVTTSVDTTNQIICGTVTSLSPFAVFSATYVATVQPPISGNGSSVFEAKRGVVPVKFTLTHAGLATCQLPPANISLLRTAGAVVGSIDQSEYLQPSDNGSNFRVDGCQYVYNLGTNSLGIGKYTVNISMEGVVVGSGTFGLQ